MLHLNGDRRSLQAPMVNGVENSSIHHNSRVADDYAAKPRVTPSIDSAGLFSRLANFLRRTSAPHGLDGTSDETKEPDAHAPDSLFENIIGLIQSFSHLGFSSARALAEAKEHALLGSFTDDKELLMEHLIQAIVKDSKGLVGQQSTATFVTTLWNDLAHPPDNYLAGEFRFRKPDGSNNSLLHPLMGASGQPYARTVKPTMKQSSSLPDPEVLFDCLLARRKAQHHPAQISSVLFYFASIIIHDIFRTDHVNFAMSKTSSYLDLAPLYGSSEEELKTMRSGNHDGKLKPDCFAETRLLMLPPGSGILLIMFNRYHNYVAEQLVAINECGRFRPRTQSSADLIAVDDEIFNTARLITCGLYVNIILIDYVRTILNLNRTDSTWQLDPRIDISHGPPIGVGNQVSAEFNLVYRWHSTVSIRDEKWLEAEFARLFPGKIPEDIGLGDFLGNLKKIDQDLEAKEPFDRPFQDFQRQSNGYHDDNQLVDSITASAADCANTYGPRQVPKILKNVEVLGIMQARSWNLATLNEFRKHFSLKPHKNFRDITSDDDTARHLENLYGHVDKVELYPGLVVEDAKEPMRPGSGLCPPYTISRSVLSDAVALVRGDRFYTTSYHPRILTDWGYAEAGYDKTVDNGCVLYKLFLRAFPNHFDPDSIYAHVPFTVAKTVRDDVLQQPDLKYKAHLYTTDAASHGAVTETVVVTSQHDLLSILAGSETDLMLAIRLLAAGSTVNSPDLRRTVLEEALHRTSLSEVQSALVQHLAEQSADNLGVNKYRLAKFYEVDVVKDVFACTTLQVTTETFGLSSDSAVGGDSLTPSELQTLLTTIAGTWTGFDRVRTTTLRQKSSSLVVRLKRALLPGISQRMKEPIHTTSSRYQLGQLGDSVLQQFHNRGLSAEQAFTGILIHAASFFSTIFLGASEILEHAVHTDRSVLGTFSHNSYGPVSSLDAMLPTIRSLLRTCSTATAVRRTTKPVVLEQGSLTTGTPVLLSAPLLQFAKGTTPVLPPNLAIGFTAPKWQHLHLLAIASILRPVLALPNLRAARVSNGPITSTMRLKRIPGRTVRSSPEKHPDGIVNGDGVAKDVVARWEYMDESWSYTVPFPTSLKVNWDFGDA